MKLFIFVQIIIVLPFPPLPPFPLLSSYFSRWTGSNTNPNNNDGQGRAGTDRSNIVLLSGMNFDEGNGMAVASSPTYGHWGNNYPAYLNKTFLGWSREDRQMLAVLNNSTSLCK